MGTCNSSGGKDEDCLAIYGLFNIYSGAIHGLCREMRSGVHTNHTGRHSVSTSSALRRRSFKCYGCK